MDDVVEQRANTICIYICVCVVYLFSYLFIGSFTCVCVRMVYLFLCLYRSLVSHLVHMLDLPPQIIF